MSASSLRCYDFAENESLKIDVPKLKLQNLQDVGNQYNIIVKIY